ncbi:hypothetical protein FHS29_002953 [Saccharothrix tamanrassetensis]|uniref:Uncharacterized protein n=1 Tax=Saccharothrix tamanrassetensis TaxID=1051531 RepID=A0A841CJT0_9PSEU|nr:hypothetical protein [Saccharothrix tamanrassetensis]MBB5956367.1 hypothetical protein [Saccharothrix tamanrassetensis]
MSSLALARTVLRLDVVGSSAGGRGRQVHLDRALESVLDLAFAAVRDPRYPIGSGSYRRADGDSATLVIDACIAKAWIVADFVLREIPIALDEVNRAANAEHRLRLRIAIDHGETVMNLPHVGGDPVVATARLVDAPRFRQALADAPERDLGLIVSDRFHTDVVQRGERGLDRVGFRPIHVPARDFRRLGWLWVPPGEEQVLRRVRGVKPETASVKIADAVRVFRAGVPDVVLGLVRSDDRD